MRVEFPVEVAGLDGFMAEWMVVAEVTPGTRGTRDDPPEEDGVELLRAVRGGDVLLPDVFVERFGVRLEDLEDKAWLAFDADAECGFDEEE